MTSSLSPDATASSTTYWIVGLSTSGSISLGWALVTGRNRVPSPAAGNTPLRTFMPDSSAGAGRRPVLAVERVLDPAAQLVLGIQAPVGVDLGGQTQDRLSAVPSDDTLRLRRLQCRPALADPLLPHP